MFKRSWVRMDVFQICCENCIVFLKRGKINGKRPVLAHLKNYFAAERLFDGDLLLAGGGGSMSISDPITATRAGVGDLKN